MIRTIYRSILSIEMNHAPFLALRRERQCLLLWAMALDSWLSNLFDFSFCALSSDSLRRSLALIFCGMLWLALCVLDSRDRRKAFFQASSDRHASRAIQLAFAACRQKAVVFFGRVVQRDQFACSGVTQTCARLRIVMRNGRHIACPFSGRRDCCS